MNSLNEDGVRYIEVRTLDINPFYKCGLIKKDMEFIHLLLVYCLLKEESDYAGWQKESLINEERVAVSAFDPDMQLLKDGEETTIKEWGLEIIDRMKVMLEEFGIDCDGILNPMADKIRNPSITYAWYSVTSSTLTSGPLIKIGTGSPEWLSTEIGVQWSAVRKI